MTPGHHDQPMYRDTRNGINMRRWLCTQPGCTAIVADDTLDQMAELAWADANGIQLPGVTTIGTPPPTGGSQ